MIESFCVVSSSSLFLIRSTLLGGRRHLSGVCGVGQYERKCNCYGVSQSIPLVLPPCGPKGSGRNASHQTRSPRSHPSSLLLNQGVRVPTERVNKICSAVHRLKTALLAVGFLLQIAASKWWYHYTTNPRRGVGAAKGWGFWGF